MVSLLDPRHEACGIAVHPASKCFRRGFTFLPRDIQRRISAYNTKYGTTPDKDTSSQSNPNTVLLAPQTKLLQDVTPSNVNTDTNIDTTTLQATIHKLQDVLPSNTEERSLPVNEQIEFLDSIDKENNTPVLNIIHQLPREIKPHTHTSNNINPLSIDLLTTHGEVNITELHTLQDQLLQPTPLENFTIHRRLHLHIDSGANVHSTTRKPDFLVYYTHKKSINIAAGQIAQSEGFGIVMVSLLPNQPPLLLAPVYYCPNATTGTLSP